MNWTEVFSGGLIGSILTLFITKAFDHFSKKQDNTFQFHKIFYERKLNAGEMAIGQMSFLYPSIVALSTMFRGMIKQESDAGIQFNKTVIDQLSDKLTECQNKVENLTQPTILYFNLKDFFQQTALFSEWQTLMDGLGKKGEAYQTLIDQYLASPTPELDVASESAFEAVQVQIGLIADSLDRFAATIPETINQIKLELSRFDSSKS